MIRRLAVPWVEEGFETVRVVRWLVHEGGELALGTVLCELESRERRVQGLRRFADDGSRRARRRARKPTFGASERASNRIRAEVRALESGVLHRILAPEAVELAIGAPLALCRDAGDAAGGDGSGSTEDVEGAPEFRVDVDVIQEAEL
jgi:pyruvate/2-oxoglutarate dehydrogenase complex dihydrolipoamide acyltransferase (E2) component